MTLFHLFAPYNEEVALIGDWQKWQPIPMHRDDDGWWRVEVPLPDGEYQYKFRVKSNSYFARGQMLDVADPRGLSVTKDANENTIIKIRDGKPVITEYPWRHDDAPLPQNSELIV
jgi:1,4-alpha-glucan branching enzyme